MKKFPIFLFSLFPALIFAQETQDIASEKIFKYNISLKLNTAFNPGVELGADYLWKSFKKEKARKKKGEEVLIKKQSEYSFYGRFGIEGGAQSFTGLNNHYGIKLRKIRNDKGLCEIGLSPIGVFASIYGETYVVDESGNIKEPSVSGRLYFSPSVSHAFGRLSKKKKIDSWFIRCNYTFLIRYNTSVMPTFNIAFGYKLK